VFLLFFYNKKIIIIMKLKDNIFMLETFFIDILS